MYVYCVQATPACQSSKWRTKVYQPIIHEYNITVNDL